MKKFTSFEELVTLAPRDIIRVIVASQDNPENINWHPEGNTYAHIKIVVNRLIETNDINLILSGLFHDLGKVSTTKPNPKTGLPCAFGHEFVSAKLVNENASFIDEMGGDADIVHGIVKNHMRIKQYNSMSFKKQKEMDELPYIKQLIAFSKADTMLAEWDIEEIKNILK